MFNVCIYIYIYIYVYIYAYIYIICMYIYILYTIMRIYFPGYHPNNFAATLALRHILYSYSLLVPMNQSVLNKLRKQRNISDHTWSTIHRVLKSHGSKLVSYTCNHVYAICIYSYKLYNMTIQHLKCTRYITIFINHLEADSKRKTLKNI